CQAGKCRWGLRKHGEEACVVICREDEWVLINDPAQFPGLFDYHRHFELELVGKCFSDGSGELRRRPVWCAEDGVAAVQEGGHLRIAQVGQKQAQTSHRYSLGFTNVDTTKKGDESGHFNA